MTARARILIVDDDAATRTMTQRILERAGYGVSTARLGAEGLRRARDEHPDLLLLDVVLPDIDGFEICRSLKASPETADAHIIMLSGLRGDAGSRAAGLEIGADDYIARPVARRELLARIEATLRLRQANVALRRQQRQLSDLIAVSADGMLVIDTEGRALFANPAAGALLRRDPDAVVGEWVGLPMAGADATDVDLLRPDGSTLTVEMRSRPLTWGGTSAWLATLRDVSEQRLSEALLRARMRLVTSTAASTAEVLQQALDELGELVSSPIGCYYFVNPDQQRLSVQAWSMRTLGRLDQAEGVGQPIELDGVVGWADFVQARAPVIHNEGATLIAVDGLAPTADPLVRELVVPITRAGRVVAALGMGDKPMAYTETDVQIVSYLGDVAWELAERKRSERERTELLAQVEAQARMVQRLIETLPQGVLLIDVEGEILIANPVAVDDLAVLAPEAEGPLTALGGVPLSDLLAMPARRGWHEVTANDRVFEVIAREIPQTSGPSQWALLIKEVTADRQVQAQLQQQERLAAIGQLAAGIAHDFNNIMAVIVLYAQMVGTQQELTEGSRARMRVIQEQAYRATTLIGQILDFSRRAQLDRQPMQVMSLLKEVLKLWERTLPDNITVSLDHDDSGCWIDADPTRIQQVLMNLATNARDAMPDGGLIEITLQTIVLHDDAQLPLPGLAAGAWMRLDFHDNGMGMSEKVQAHLFEPFFTTKPPGEGTGLGLAQIHGIVKQHGGDIDVTSGLGEGTTVSIYLPALPPPAGAGQMLTDANAVPKGAGERVLVVEDSMVTRAAVVETLEMLGYRVLEATNGQEALALYDAASAPGGEPIDMIVSDLTMPEMGGKALVAALREDQRHVPVLILSGHIHDDEIAALEALDRVRCLRKPVDFAKLAQVVAASLSG